VILFTYGSLKKGYWNHHLLGDSLYIGKGVTYEKYALYNHTFPFAVHEEVEDTNNVLPVLGELYHVTREVLDEVDSLEILYERKSRPIISDHRGFVSAFIYEYNKSSPYGFTLMCDTNNGAYEWKG
jgi:gamma-glutamylcyclotransferase (GGCT)/AIG2-like uncharacterized protein YtfP